MSSVTVNMDFIDLRSAESSLVLGRHVDNLQGLLKGTRNGAWDPGPLDLRRVIRPAELILRKRDGGELGADELAEFVLAYARDEVPDYQMAAFCMAVFFRGLTPVETFALTDAMVRSGDTLDLHLSLIHI